MIRDSGLLFGPPCRYRDSPRLQLVGTRQENWQLIGILYPTLVSRI